MSSSVEPLRNWLAVHLGMDLAEIQHDTRLVSTGLLDSLTILELCTYLEQSQGVTMDWTRVGIENLDTIDAMLALCARLR